MRSQVIWCPFCSKDHTESHWSTAEPGGDEEHVDCVRCGGVFSVEITVDSDGDYFFDVQEVEAPAEEEEL